MRLFLAFSALLAVGCGSPRGATLRGVERDPAGRVDHPALAELCRDAWEFRLADDPIQATYLGDPRYHGELAIPTPERRAWRRERIAALLERARAVAEDVLDDLERLARGELERDLALDLAELDLAVDMESWSLDPLDGMQNKFLSLAADQPCATATEREQLLRRWSAMARWFDASGENLRRGLANGRVAPRSTAQKVLAQLDAWLATPPAACPLIRSLPAPALKSSDPPRFRARLLAIVQGEVYPAVERYRALVQGEILPRARGDDRPGIEHVDGGREAYALFSRRSTTLELSPGEIHALGLAEVQRIQAEIAALGERIFGTREIAHIQRRLRTDPAMHFRSAEEIESKAREALRRAEAAVPAVFGRLPRARCEVLPVPAHEAPATTIAYYREPALDGSRPGRYYVNTLAPETRTRYEAEVLAFHEAVPGHHTQIAIAQELEGVPAVLRHGEVTAFVEGWALYTERLCDELELYGGDLDRLGLLSFDAWRAARLVVDTGIHALDWSRERALAYLLENTLLAENNVENEVDRYIAWPGQALAYKIGQLEILRLREQAEDALGSRFRLAGFHDVVLGRGAVSLSALRAAVERWIEHGDGQR